MRKITIITLLILLIPVCYTSAQENKRVEVTTIYRPEVAPAKKLLAPTTMVDSPTLDVEIEYDVKPETWTIELQDENFKAATATYWDYNRSRRGYMKLGVGLPLGSDVQLRYATQNSHVGYFGMNLVHDGEFTPQQNSIGMERTIKQSYDMRNEVGIFGGAYIGRQMFEASLSGGYDVYNRYAELAENPYCQQFARSALKLRFGDDFTNLTRVNFAVEAHGDYWGYPTPSSENIGHIAGEYNIGGSANVARAFAGSEVSLHAAYDLWSGILPLNYRNSRFEVGAGYSWNYRFIDIELGIGYMFDKVVGREKASHFILPKAKLMFDLKKAEFSPYVEFDTDISQNGAATLYAENPYIDFGTMCEQFTSMPNTRSYDLTVGFTGVLFQSRFAYRAYIGARFMRDEIFWYVPEPGLFAAATANDKRLVFGAELQYRPIASLLIGVGLHYRADRHESEYVVSDPQFVADAIVEYRINKFKIYAMTDIIGRREWSDLSSPTGMFTTPVKVDLRAGIAFAVSNKCEIYADGYNLLNRTGDKAIYDYAYYYRNGIGFMAGIKVSF